MDSIKAMVRSMAAALLLCLASSVAGAQPAYPSKPIRWIVPYTAGAMVDVWARKLASVVARELGGATIVIENKAGASGMIGATEVSRASPDGYTLLFTTADPMIATTLIADSVPYDTFKNFTLITKIQTNSPTLIVGSDNPAKNLRELVNNAKSSHFTYGSFGPGSFPQLVMEQLALDAGVKFVEIPYRSPSQAITDATANVLSAAFD